MHFSRKKNNFKDKNHQKLQRSKLVSTRRKLNAVEVQIHANLKGKVALDDTLPFIFATYEGPSINKLQNGAIPLILKIGKIRNIRFVGNFF